MKQIIPFAVLMILVISLGCTGNSPENPPALIKGTGPQETDCVANEECYTNTLETCEPAKFKISSPLSKWEYETVSEENGFCKIEVSTYDNEGDFVNKENRYVAKGNSFEDTISENNYMMEITPCVILETDELLLDSNDLLYNYKFDVEETQKRVEQGAEHVKVYTYERSSEPFGVEQLDKMHMIGQIVEFYDTIEEANIVFDGLNGSREPFSDDWQERFKWKNGDEVYFYHHIGNYQNGDVYTDSITIRKGNVISHFVLVSYDSGFFTEEDAMQEVESYALKFLDKAKCPYEE